MDRLHTLLNPSLLGRILDVHELDTDSAAVGLADRFNNLTQRRRFETQHAIDKDRPVKILVGKAVGLGVELRMRLDRLEAEGIQLRLEMSTHAVGADQHQSPDGIQGRCPYIGGGL